MANVQVTTDMTFLLCVRCFCSYGLPQHMLDARRKDGKSFYCPRGHRQSFDPPPGPDDAAEVEKRRRLVKELHDREQAEARAADAAAGGQSAERAAALDSPAAEKCDTHNPLATCQHCGKSYTSKAWLARHLHSAHA